MALDSVVVYQEKKGVESETGFSINLKIVEIQGPH